MLATQKHSSAVNAALQRDVRFHSVTSHPHLMQFYLENKTTVVLLKEISQIFPNSFFNQTISLLQDDKYPDGKIWLLEVNFRWLIILNGRWLTSHPVGILPFAGHIVHIDSLQRTVCFLIKALSNLNEDKASIKNFNGKQK